MICVDTTFLIDLWRNKDNPDHPSVRVLHQQAEETFVVPAHSAGEFLEGGACLSDSRFLDAMRFLRFFQSATVGLETAQHYARIVSHLRIRNLLSGASKVDMWIAASTLEHGARLVTRNVKHFKHVPGLEIVSY